MPTGKKNTSDQLELGDISTVDVADETMGEPAETGEPADPIVAQRSAAPRKLRTPKILKLDLDKGPATLAAHLKAKNPDGELKRYLVIAAWMKHQLQLDQITTDHIYTAYRSLGSVQPRLPGLLQPPRS